MRDVLARGSQDYSLCLTYKAGSVFTFICTDVSHNVITQKGGLETGQLRPIHT